MHTSYDPGEITEDYLETICSDLQCDLENVLNNDGKFQQEMYDAAIQTLRHIESVLDAMIPEDEW